MAAKGRPQGGCCALTAVHMVLAAVSFAGALASGCDEQALAAACSGQPAVSACAICVGRHQHEMKKAGCTAADVRAFCAEAGLTTVYASATSGSDRNTGRSAAAALQTMTAALTAVRRDKAKRLLLDGKFGVAETIVLNSRYAGLQIDRWPGASSGQVPTLSGGAELAASGWAPAPGTPGVFQTSLSVAQSSALDGAGVIFVGGQRRAVVRTPTLHWNASLDPLPADKGSDVNTLGFVYSAGDIDPAWSLDKASVARWTVAAFHSWTKAYHRVKHVFPHNRTILFATPARFPYGMYEYCSKERWYIEGVPELRLQPGSGRWKATATTLFYAPVAGEPFPSLRTPVVVPTLGTLLEIYAANVSISNLQIEHTAGVLGCGAPPAAPGGSRSPGACDADLAGMAPAAVSVGSAPGVAITNYTARDVGGYGIQAAHAAGIQIERSGFFGCGAGGVHIEFSPGARVANSFVVGFGQRYPAGVGVAVVNSPNGTVSHCDISGGLYNGLIFGSVKDSGAYSKYEFNIVHGNGHETDDGICDFGGIHGSAAGALLPVYITSNIFHNITAFQNGGSGVYLDVSTTGVQVERNLVFDVAEEAINWNVNPGEATGSTSTLVPSPRTPFSLPFLAVPLPSFSLSPAAFRRAGAAVPVAGGRGADPDRQQRLHRRPRQRVRAGQGRAWPRQHKPGGDVERVHPGRVRTQRGRG
eukprot:SAG22_NODE_2448_length_2557_cov_7.838893_1_plen_700_part_00